MLQANAQRIQISNPFKYYKYINIINSNPNYVVRKGLEINFR